MKSSPKKKKMVAIYADAAELPLYKARAAALGLSLSQYLWCLAKRDVVAGGEFMLTPKKVVAARSK